MPVQQGIEQFEADRAFFDEHREELLERYPDRWIAIYHQQVVGTARDPRRLAAQLRRKGIPPGEVFREYVTARDDVLIL